MNYPRGFYRFDLSKDEQRQLAQHAMTLLLQKPRQFILQEGKYNGQYFGMKSVEKWTKDGSLSLESGVVELKVGRIAAVSPSEQSLREHAFSLLLQEC